MVQMKELQFTHIIDLYKSNGPILIVQTVLCYFCGKLFWQYSVTIYALYHYRLEVYKL